ncbi:M15 family metallopeptidase [Candidatus Babeliales bacterium]|nr:M15 family metallopeptidase [Candidatus Babeliales bacterium]
MNKPLRIFLFVIATFFSCVSAVVSTTDLVNVKKLCPTIQVDLMYTHDNNFTRSVVYDCPSDVCYVRQGTALKLIAVQEELAQQGLGLKIADGYRPHAVQYIFWNLVPDPRYVADPAKGSKHNRGSAVDVTLVRLSDGQELPMPSQIDDFTEKAHRTYETMGEQEAFNCRLLEDIMTKHGFVGLPTEWWHFDDVDWQNYEISDVSFAALAKN